MHTEVNLIRMDAIGQHSSPKNLKTTEALAKVIILYYLF